MKYVGNVGSPSGVGIQVLGEPLEKRPASPLRVIFPLAGLVRNGRFTSSLAGITN